MRTTVTLDDDLAKLLEKEARKSGNSFKRVINDTLRRGLIAPKQPSRKPFVVTPIDSGLPPYDKKIEELLEELEGADYR